MNFDDIINDDEQDDEGEINFYMEGNKGQLNPITEDATEELSSPNIIKKK